MWFEIGGALLLFSAISIAIAEWFALAKLNSQYEHLEWDYLALVRDHKRVLKQLSGQE